jgi:hypothetical protein
LGRNIARLSGVVVHFDKVNMKLTAESLILIAICLADLLLTVFLLKNGPVREGNPLMAYYLQFGLTTFVIVKLCLMFPPILIVEWCRKYKPDFARFMLRFAITAYLGVYVVSFAAANVPRLIASKQMVREYQLQARLPR